MAMAMVTAKVDSNEDGGGACGGGSSRGNGN